MAKSKNKNRSEVEYLRGRVRQLEAELKYYRRRDHLMEAPLEEIIDQHEIEEINASQCPRCKRGILTEFDFKFAILKKCGNCEYEERQGKK